MIGESPLLELAVLSFEMQVATTVAVAVVLATAFWLARVRPGPFGRLADNRVGMVVLAVLLAAIVTVAAVVLVVAWGLTGVALNVLSRAEVTAGTGVQVLLSFAILAGAYVGTGFLERMLDEFAADRRGISPHQTEVTFRLLQLSIYVAALIAALGLWDFELRGLLISAGFLGIIVGMAARQTLGSIIAGFVLMFSRPFEVGDWVEIADDEGIVTDITIVDTRIQTFDGEYVVIPNETISGSTLVNRTRKGRLRLHVEVGVDYGTDLDRAADVATEAMREVDDVLSVPNPNVVCSEFGDSAVVLDLLFWIDKPSSRRRWRARSNVIKAVKEAFEEDGIAIPFPQRELSPRDTDDGFRVSRQQDTHAADGGEQHGDGDTA